MVPTPEVAPPPFDDRPFVRLDHGMPENAKVVGLSDPAFRLYIEAMCWCSRQRSDGVIPGAMMRRLGKPKQITELVTAGLLETVLDSAYAIHDYLKFQRSRAEIEAFSGARSDSGKLGNHTRWHVARRRFDEGCEHCIASVAIPSQGRSQVRSQNDRDPVADTDADADAEISFLSPRSVDGERTSSSSRSVARAKGK